MMSETHPEQPVGPVALTVDQCAAQLQIHHSTVEKWIREGHLKAFVRPGKKPGSRPGRKSYRIWPDDWTVFCRRFTMTGVATPAPAPTVVVGAVAAGTDGISRRSRKRG